MLNLVILLERIYGDLAEKFDPSRPAFQGYAGWLKLKRIDQYMTSYLWSLVTIGLSRTVSEINGDFDRKSQNFPTPELNPR